MTTTLLLLLTLAGGMPALAQSPATDPTGPTNPGASGYRNVAFWSEPGVQIAVSSHSYRSGAMTRDESLCPLNRPFAPSQSATHCWASSEYEHLPQWVWIHFPSPRRIDKVVLFAASPATSPVEFSGQYPHDGGTTFATLFHTRAAQFEPRNLSCAVGFKPVVATDFRLVIQRSPAFVTNQSWVARLAQVEVYGDDATSHAEQSTVTAPETAAPNLSSALPPTQFVPDVEDKGRGLVIRGAS